MVDMTEILRFSAAASAGVMSRSVTCQSRSESSAAVCWTGNVSPWCMEITLSEKPSRLFDNHASVILWPQTLEKNLHVVRTRNCVGYHSGIGFGWSSTEARIAED
ncbi:hypothetical protein RRG08_032467 [Elysia crispata]|uniref:Uncharacterized protein n=1 Tax=Elysia crispata TaxID=231223 RepID=A0AAE1BAI0_9GAST|nr:hypothetical protein RRG08_032467 [Elysia crispata]